MTAGATRAYPNTFSLSRRCPKVRPTIPRRYAAVWAASAIGRRYRPDGPRGSRLRADEGPVADAMRPVGLRAELLVPELLVLGVVAVEPADLGVALEREHVRGDAVEEPAVVADHHRA